MKCLRCGFCCQHMAVKIIKNPAILTLENNTVEHLSGRPCPHLSGPKPGHYSCAVWDHPMFKNILCATYPKQENQDDECVIGKAFLGGEPITFKVEYPEDKGV